MPDLLMFKFVGPPLLLLFIIIENILYSRKKEKSNFKFRLVLYSFVIYLLFVMNYTLFPLPISEIPITEYKIMELKNNFIPFGDGNGNFFNQILSPTAIANILILLPLGIYLPLILKGKGFKYILMLGLLTTISIELVQFTISSIIGVTYRTVDVNDIILNTFGFIIGYLIFKLIDPVISSVLKPKVTHT